MSKRADVILVEEGYFESRAKATEAIKLGQVKINGVVIKKPSQEIEDGQKVELSEERLKYVSRGGLKLEKAIKEFSIDFNGKVVLDMGSSTGGFTEVSLLNGAKKVYAVDVGCGQLHQMLKQNQKVVSYLYEKSFISYCFNFGFSIVGVIFWLWTSWWFNGWG